MDKRIKWSQSLCIWFLICLTAAGFLAAADKTVRLETILSCDGRPGIYYGVNSGTNEYHIFMADTNKERSDLFFLPWANASDGANYTPLQIRAGERNSAYLCLEAEYPDKNLRLLIQKYDFDARNITQIYSRDLQENETFYGFFAEAETAEREAAGPRLCLLTAKGGEETEAASVSVTRMEADGSGSQIQSGYKAQLPYFQSELSGDGTLLYLAGDGSVYQSDSDGTNNLLFSNDRENSHNVNYILENNSVSFYNLDEDCFYEITAGQGNPQKTEDPLGDQRQALGSIIGITPVGEGTYTAMVMGGDFRVLPAFLGQESQLIEEITRPVTSLLSEISRTTALLYLTGAALLGAYLLVRRLNQGVFPTALKIICIVIPLAVAGYLTVSWQLTELFREQIGSEEQQRVAAIAQAYEATIDSRYFTEEAANLAYVNQLNDDFIATYPAQKTVLSGEGAAAFQLSHNYVDMTFYYLYDDEFYTISDESLTCTPIRYTYYGADASALERMAAENQVILVNEETIQEGEILAYYVPVYKNGSCVGGFRAMLNGLFVEGSAKRETLIIKELTGTYMALMLAILFLIAAVSIHPLRRMEKAVRAMADGRRKIKVEVRGRDEVAEMQQIFNRMADNLGDYLERTEGLKQSNEPFVPKAMIRLLGGEDIRTVKAGDECSVEGAVFVLRVCGFESIQPHVEAERLFNFMDAVLKHAIPPVEQEKGIIERFSQGGMTVLFPKDAGAALRAASQTVARLRREELSMGEYPAVFTVGIAAGELRLFTAGSEERMEVLAVSPHIRVAETLQRLAGAYGAGLLITKTAASRIDGFNRSFPNRLLCRVYLEEEDRAELVYEVFGWEEQETVARRQRTKELFEAGVELFVEKSWHKARETFAAVMKADITDVAAARYFTVCDEYIEKGMSELEENTAGVETGGEQDEAGRDVREIC